MERKEPGMVDARFGPVEQKIRAAVETVEADSSASPVLVAVVREFEKKVAKTRTGLDGEGATAREAVVELEQAGDSAKAAAEADGGISGDTRQAVLDAHMAICVLKNEW